MEGKESEEKTWLFSYGSNSAVQLRARVRNPKLNSLPAAAPGWDRIFCYQADRWGGTGVASLARCHHSSVLGAAAQLTTTELNYLDTFELPAYDRVNIDIIVSEDGEENTVKAVAYLAVQPKWIAPPSEQYLTAIHFMLREQWAHIHPNLSIAIKGIFKPQGRSDGYHEIVTISEWVYPGPHLLSLPALCVEVNARMPPSKCWVMPITITEIMKEFESIGVQSTAQLAVKMHGPNGVNVFGSDRRVVLLPSGAELDTHAMHTFKDLLKLD